MSSVREMTSKEMIENSNLNSNTKDLILSRMKEEYCRTEKIMEIHEDTISEQRCLIESYRMVLQDMIYSNYLNRK